MQSLNLQDINSRKNNRLDLDTWRPIINEWDRNKESQKTYCARLGINVNTFMYMRVKHFKKNKSKSNFIPVTLVNTENKNASPCVLILENTRGFKLQIPHSLSQSELTKILQLAGW